MRLKTVGSRPSRDMANQTRAWPSWKTRIEEIMPSRAPIRTKSRTQCKAAAAGQQREPLERVDHRRGVAHHRLPGHNAAEHDGHRAVEHGAGHQRGQDADGQVALRVLALLGRRRDRVEADVSEEDDGAAGEHAGPAVGHEGMPVVRLDEAGAGKDEDQNGGDLDQHHDVVGAGRLADAAHQNAPSES